jgi:V-type H+-transporting ATPase 16kDa proteolipid subunit
MISSILSTLLVILQSTDTQSAPFFGFMGVTSALVFACFGAAYGTAKSGVGVCAMGVMHPNLIMRSIIPVVMAGVVAIYGLIIAVIVGTNSMFFIFLSAT